MGSILGRSPKSLTQTNFLNCHGCHQKTINILWITLSFGVSLKTTVIDPTRYYIKWILLNTNIKQRFYLLDLFSLRHLLCFLSTSGLSQAEGPGGLVPPQFLADQLTLSQPGAHYAHHITMCPSGFSDLATALFIYLFGCHINIMGVNMTSECIAYTIMCK